MASFLQSVFGAFSRKPAPTRIEQRDIARSWIERLDIDTVIDVGANEGQFVDRVRADGFTGQIISFEPLQEAFAKLSARHGSSRNWRGLRLALGEADAELTMEVAGNQMMSSSLLHMLPNHVDAYPESAIYRTEKVEVRRLDQVLKDEFNPSSRVFLKVDTQGFEDQVLKGASGIMQHVRLLELELSLVHLYKGQVLLPEMLNLASDLGFVPVDLGRGFEDHARGRLLQVDGLFVRSGLEELPPRQT